MGRLRGARGGGRRDPHPGGRAGGLLPHAPLCPHRGAAPRGRSGLFRYGRRSADEPTDPGRRGQRQDDGGRGQRLGGHPRGAPGRLHGADGDPGRAASHNAARLFGTLRLPRGKADRVADREGKAGDESRPRSGRDRPRRRHARASDGRRGLFRSRARRHGRAAPLRRAAARRALREGGGAARPRHVRDAHPADARADDLTAIWTSP